MSYDSTQVRATSEPKHALDTAEATFTTSSTSLLPPSSPSVVTPAARPTVRMPESSISFHRDHRASKGPIHYPFWFGGSASCCAAMVTHPLDLLKVRLQTQPPTQQRTLLQMFTHILRIDGLPGLYKGLSASILRQATYSTTRFGVYEAAKEAFTGPSTQNASDATQPSMLRLIALSSFSGLLGGIAGNPADVLNVRMQHDAALPLARRRNYRHAIDGLTRMLRHEGATSLFRGVVPNSARATLMTASQLASYDGFKRFLLSPAVGLNDNLSTHFTASFAAGFVATTVCSPVDVIKTRVMSAHESGQGVLKLLGDITRQEGFRWCFRGWVPSFVRLGPHTIATFLFLEQHKKVYRRWVGREEG